MEFRGAPGMFDFTIGHGGRNCKGTEVHVKVDPIIEEFVKSLGDGTTRPLQQGGLWYPLGNDTLEVYAFGNGQYPAPDFDGYALDMVNKALLVDSAPPQLLPNGGVAPTLNTGDVVNLSFLRLKGISGPQGVRFGVKLLYSPSLMDHMKTKCGRACRSLCRDYIVPVSFHLLIVNEA